MKIISILYGQERTFKYTHKSIFRLFKEKLNCDFIIIINDNNDTHFNDNLCDGGYLNNFNCLPIDEFNDIIKIFEPKIYKHIDINNIMLREKYKYNPKYEKCLKYIKENKFYSTTWDEYKKCPKNINLYSNDEIINFGCKIEKISNPDNVILDLINVEIYLRNLGLFYLNKIKEQYTHVIFIRTDTIWFENYEQKKNIIKDTSISNQETFNNIITFNNMINNYNYELLCNNIKNIINNNENDVLSYYFYNEKLNIYCPIEQCSLIRINHIIPYNGAGTQEKII
jgi:hypothetical protein